MNKDLDFEFYRESWADIQPHGNPSEQAFRLAKFKFPKAIKLSSKMKQDAYKDWSLVYAYQEDYPNALLKLKRVLAIKPHDLTTLYQISGCLNQLQRPEEALVYIKKSLELDPEDLIMHEELLKTLQLMNEFENFEFHYEELLDLHPENKTNSRFYYVKAQALSELNENPLALESYKKAVELFPDDLSFRKEYGKALYDEAYYLEALSQFKKVIVLKPRDKDAHLHIALLYYNLGDIYEAIEELEDNFMYSSDIAACFSCMILCKYHLYQTNKAIEFDREQLKAVLNFDNKEKLQEFFHKELKRTELKLQEISNKEVKNFQLRKLSSLKFVLSILESIFDK